MNITAKDIIDFKKIDDKLQELHSMVYEQIIDAKFGLSGIDCRLDTFGYKELYFPKDVIKILDNEIELIVICKEFLFRFEKTPESTYILNFIQ